MLFVNRQLLSTTSVSPGGSSVVQLARAYDKSHGEESPPFIVRVRTSRNGSDTYDVALTDCWKRTLKETPLAKSTIYYRPCSNNTSEARDARSYVAMTNVALMQIGSDRTPAECLVLPDWSIIANHGCCKNARSMIIESIDRWLPINECILLDESVLSTRMIHKVYISTRYRTQIITLERTWLH